MNKNMTTTTTTTSTEIPVIKELKVISDDEIIEELKKNGSLISKTPIVIHVTKPSSEKDAGSSESSSEKKYSVVINEEGNLFSKSYVVWLISYESTSEGIIKITAEKCLEDKKNCSKEEALAKAIDIELEKKVETVYVSNEASEKKNGEIESGKKETDASENVKETENVKDTENVKETENVEEAENVKEI